MRNNCIVDVLFFFISEFYEIIAYGDVNSFFMLENMEK